MVHMIKNEKIRVLNPNMTKRPPTASLKAPIQAKNTGNIANNPPYAATSPGNQADTSNKLKFWLSAVQGIPNLSDPKLEVRTNPQMILGKAVIISDNQLDSSTGFKMSSDKVFNRVIVL